MFIFFYLLGYRSLSAIQNSLGYSGRCGLMTVFSIIIFSIPLIAYFGFNNMLVSIMPVFYGLVLAMAFVSSFFVLMVDYSFRKWECWLPKDKVFYSLMVNGSMTLACLVSTVDVLDVVLSIYPGLVLQESIESIGMSNRDFYKRKRSVFIRNTRMLGQEIPRFSFKMRSVLGIASIIIFIITHTV